MKSSHHGLYELGYSCATVVTRKSFTIKQFGVNLKKLLKFIGL